MSSEPITISLDWCSLNWPSSWTASMYMLVHSNLRSLKIVRESFAKKCKIFNEDLLKFYMLVHSNLRSLKIVKESFAKKKLTKTS